LFDPLGPFRGRNLPLDQAEGDILRHGEVRPEGIVLEDHRSLAEVRREVRDVAFTEEDRAAGGEVQAGQAAQQRSLSAAGGAEQEEEFTWFDREGDAIQYLNRLRLGRIAFADGTEAEGFHDLDFFRRKPFRG
jgi:hypothetical protein